MTNHSTIARAYANGATATAIASDHGKMPETIRRILRLYGHPVPTIAYKDQLAGL